MAGRTGGTVCTAGHNSHWLPSEVCTLSTPAETNREIDISEKMCAAKFSTVDRDLQLSSLTGEKGVIVENFIIIQRNSLTVGSLVLSKEEWNKEKNQQREANFSFDFTSGIL